MTKEDFDVALEEMLREGLLERVDGDKYRLTPAGMAAAEHLIDTNPAAADYLHEVIQYFECKAAEEAKK